jgi:hypothetical protein
MTGAVIGVAVAATAFAAPLPPATQSFGVLSYPGPGGTPISFVWPGSGLSDNTNFLYTNTNIGTLESPRWLTIGLRAHAYYDAPNPIPTYADTNSNTFLVQPGSSLWTPVPPTPTPPGFANAPQWGFSWSISVDGDRSAAATSGLYWSMRIDGPGSTGNWGTLLSGGAVNSDATLNAWQLGFSYFALSSGATPVNPLSPSGPFYPTGLWDGLNFNPNTLGNYQFTIAVRNGSATGAIAGQTMMNVLVPAPGAVAVLGIAGLTGSRRRRS